MLLRTLEIKLKGQSWPNFDGLALSVRESSVSMNYGWLKKVSLVSKSYLLVMILRKVNIRHIKDSYKEKSTK